jgi:hypothetical protein
LGRLAEIGADTLIAARHSFQRSMFSST